MNLAILRLAKGSRCAWTDKQSLGTPPAGNAFDYLFRESRHARRLQRMRHIIAMVVALIAVASGLYGCT
jgi:hypothetical protein